MLATQINHSQFFQYAAPQYTAEDLSSKDSNILSSIQLAEVKSWLEHNLNCTPSKSYSTHLPLGHI